MNPSFSMMDCVNIEVNSLPVNRNRLSWEDLLEYTTSNSNQHRRENGENGLHFGDHVVQGTSSDAYLNINRSLRWCTINRDTFMELNRASYLWKDAYAASNYLFDIDERDENSERATAISEESMLWIVSME